MNEIRKPKTDGVTRRWQGYFRGGLTKHAPRVQIRAQELAIPLHTRLGRQAVHISARHQPLQELPQRPAPRVDVDLVLPLELGPHGPKLGLGARRRLDIVHDIHVHVVQDDHVGVG